MDDPFDQLNPDMPDVGLIDNNTSGPDNRPDGESAWIDSDVTDENGEARVTFTVSMQPGNNYRAGASLLQDALTQAPTGQTMQQVADALNVVGDPKSGYTANGEFADYSVPLTWSPMLTVWRKLHVEADSMNVEPTTVTGREPDWQRKYIFDITVSPPSSTLHLSQPLSGHDPHHFEGGRVTVEDNGWTFSIIDHTDDTLEIDRVLVPPEWSYVQNHYAIVKDDDPNNGLLPTLYTIDAFVKNAYKDAYVDIVDLDVQYNPNRYVSFDLYLTTVEMDLGLGWNNSKDLGSATDYWTVLLVAAHQAGGYVSSGGDRDNDPDPLVDNSTHPMGPYWPGDEYEETLFTGATVRFGDWDTVLFRATIVDFPWYGHFESQNIAHEIGHSGGNTGTAEEHHDEGGLMGASLIEDDDGFFGQTLNRFREAQEW